MAYCGKCGAPLDGEKFCPNCGASVELKSVRRRALVSASARRPKRTRPWKKLAIAALIVVIAFLIVTRFSSTVDKPCDWCGDRPSVAYKLNDGSYSYVCKDCSKRCAFCGDKATKHYENLLNMMVFVCNDCYKEVGGR